MHTKIPAAACLGFTELWGSLQGKPRTAITAVRLEDLGESLQCNPRQAAYVEELPEEVEAW